MMQQGIMAQHQQMMGQPQHPGMVPGQMMPGGMQPGQQIQPHPTHPHPGLQQGQVTQPLPPPGPEQPKLDNISRAKALVPTLKELVSVSIYWKSLWQSIFRSFRNCQHFLTFF